MAGGDEVRVQRMGDLQEVRSCKLKMTSWESNTSDREAWRRMVNDAMQDCSSISIFLNK